MGQKLQPADQGHLNKDGKIDQLIIYMRPISAAVMFEWFDNVGYCADIEGLEKQHDINFIKLPELVKRIDWGYKKAA